MVSFSAAFSAAVSPVIFPVLRVAFVALFFAAISGRHLLGELRRLEDPDGVPEGVAQAHVDTVEVIGGLLREVGDAARQEGLVEVPHVVRLEDDGAHGAFGDQLAELRGGGLVVQRRAWLLQEDLDVRVAPGAHRQPAEGTLLDVLSDLQPELVDVEVKGLVLVEDHDGGHVQLDHRLFLPIQDLIGRSLLLGVGLIVSLRAVGDRPDEAIGVRERPAIPAPLQLRRGLEDLPAGLLVLVHDLVDPLFATNDVIKYETAEAVAVGRAADHFFQSFTALEANVLTAVLDEVDRNTPVDLDLPSKALGVETLGSFHVFDAKQDRAYVRVHALSPLYS